MGKGINKTICLGRMIGTPRRKIGKRGAEKREFMLEIDDSYRNKQGKLISVIDLIPVEFYGGAIDAIDNFCVHGTQLFIEGKMKLSEFTNEDGLEKETFVLSGINIQTISNSVYTPKRTPTEINGNSY